MPAAQALHLGFIHAAATFPDRIAVEEAAGAAMSYRALDALSDRVRDLLAARGVRPGDRVGLWLPKTIDGVAAIVGILKAGAAYVPVDPGSPPWRAAWILRDCDVRLSFVAGAFAADLAREAAAAGGVPTLAIEHPGGGAGLRAALDAAGPAPRTDTVVPAEGALAYLLYTSGSTGTPKGVMLSHRAALDFVAWCTDTFGPSPDDRFSSHAPLHFDLSILDLYVPLSCGARVVLIGEELGRDPKALAAMIAAKRLTVWYSTPSILMALEHYGLLERHDLSALRLVLFAGEVYPAPRLRALTSLLPQRRYLNLYGPTETNVCTWHEIPLPVPDARVAPYPIGRVCGHYRARVVDEAGHAVAASAEGELVIAGPGILSGYWNLPERDATAFFLGDDGQRWYRTGDLVVEEAGGVYVYHGRRDRMVKRHGYRIELGEIEAGLAAHPAVREAAVVATADAVGGTTRITAFVGTGGAPVSIIALKGHCVERLPRYMTPDVIRIVAALPRTSTDKTDYQALKALAE